MLADSGERTATLGIRGTNERNTPYDERLSDNTILVFTSDNGAMESGSSLPLRGHKHTIYDGGVRLPTVVHWPKGGLVGGKKWDGLCGALDMFPTLMAMTGSIMPPTRPLDGNNVWPALRDNQPSPVESYYWVWRGQDAIRTAQWKLHHPPRRRQYHAAVDERHRHPRRQVHGERVFPGLEDSRRQRHGSWQINETSNKR